ncbi:MAG: amidohydrolase family protein [Erysipelotrichaceae bacterium]|nr:amidohydrolase family protein [Erysipelotrichaceae bacterium]
MQEYVIKNGILIDKHNDLLFVKKDVLVKDGLICRIAEDIDPLGREVVDAKGRYVSAGIIDVHIHNRLRGGKQAQTGQEEIGLASVDELGIDRGATTVIECGSVTVQDIDKFAEESDKAKTRYFGLLSGHGEDGFGRNGSQNIDLIVPEHYAKAVSDYPGYIVGLKVACSKTTTGDKGYMLVRHAKKICKLLDLPLTIHIGNFPPDPCGLIEFLGEGDVVTHTYHGKEVSLFMEDGTPKESFVRARNRGVRFDVGHGTASFDYTVYDRARRKGFTPDIISTDMRAINIAGPVFSIETVMSKVMNLGLPLEDCVNAVTYEAARTYKLEGLGQLKEGMLADFTFFEVNDCDMEVADCYFHMQHLTKIIEAKEVIVSKNGSSQLYEVKAGLPF